MTSMRQSAPVIKNSPIPSGHVAAQKWPLVFELWLVACAPGLEPAVRAFGLRPADAGRGAGGDERMSLEPKSLTLARTCRTEPVDVRIPTAKWHPRRQLTLPYRPVTSCLARSKRLRV